MTLTSGNGYTGTGTGTDAVPVPVPVPGGSGTGTGTNANLRVRVGYEFCCTRTTLVGNTWQRLTLVLREFLSNGLTPSRLHIVISFFTHADHVFLGLPRSLVPGSPKCVMELMHEVARCTCPYHLRRRVRRTAVISSRSSFWRSH